MTRASFRKAQWIVRQMEAGTDPEDVYDVLLGNISNPSEFVALVESLSDEYDDDFRSNNERLNG